MAGYFFYLVGLAAIFLITSIMAAFWLSNAWANIKGAPYVPTSQGEIEHILSFVKPKKGQILVELGSGDGRFLRTSVKKYDIWGIGYEINPILVFYSRLRKRLDKLENLNYLASDMFSADFSKADIIYTFLMPWTLKKLRSKFKAEVKPSAVIISHGFSIEGFEKYLIKKLHRKPYPTYYYRIR